MNTHLSLSENKTLEVQLELWEEDSCWFDFHISWSRKTDHAGFNFDISIWRFAFYFSICDNRHWDYDKNTWSTYKGASADTLTEDD
jgi:hypothetical protein